MNATLGAVEIVLPVHDDEVLLGASVDLLLRYLREDFPFPFPFSIVIVDNAATGGTRRLADELAEAHPELVSLRVRHEGHGLAIRTAWLSSRADVLAYTALDPAASLERFLPLVAPLLSGHSELAVATTNVRGRRLRRRGILPLLAIRADAAHRIVPLVHDDGASFDAELLRIADRERMRIHEVPLDRATAGR